MGTSEHGLARPDPHPQPSPAHLDPNPNQVGKSEHGLALRKRLARKRAAEARAERCAERQRAAEAAKAAEAERAAARAGRNAVAAAADGARRRAHARSLANAAAAREAAAAEASRARQRAAEEREAAEARRRVRCTTLVEETADGGWQVSLLPCVISQGDRQRIPRGALRAIAHDARSFHPKPRCAPRRSACAARPCACSRSRLSPSPRPWRATPSRRARYSRLPRS